MRTFGEVLHERWRPEDGENTQWFRLCTPKKDSFGTCIEPLGAKLERYRSNPVFLWMHQSGPKASSPQTPGPEAVIGRCKQVDQQRDHMDVLMEFDVQEEMARRCLRKVKDGYLRAVSIGFEPVKVVPTTITDSAMAERYGAPVGQVVPVINEWTLMEASLVIVGSNADALKLMRSLDPSEPAPEESAVVPENRAHVTGHVVAFHAYGLDRGPWDAAKEESVWQKACFGDKSVKDASADERHRYAEMFAYVEGDGSVLAEYKLPHHSVHQGALLTNFRGVTAALAALHGARGGVAIPAAHRKEVEHHLLEHEKEFASKDAARAHLHGSHATFAAGGGNVSTTKVQGENKMKMHPEHRWIARSLIGSHMRAAADHMTGMAHCGPGMESMHKMHTEGATAHMEHAHRMAGCLRDYMGDDDDDDMRMARLAQPRVLDAKAGTPELRARFAEVAQLVHRFDVRTADEAAALALGMKVNERGLSDKIEARIEGFKLTQERYTVLAQQARQQRDEASNTERQSLVDQLLSNQLITPHLAQRMLGKIEGESAWTMLKISDFRATLGDQPIVPITGVRSLDPAAPAASVPALPAGVQERGAAPAAQPTFAAPVVPAPIPAAPTGAPVTDASQSRIAMAVANSLRGTDLNMDRLKLRAQINEHTLRGEFTQAAALTEQLNEKKVENERYWEDVVKGRLNGNAFHDQIKPRSL